MYIRVHPINVILSLAIIGFAIFMIFNNKLKVINAPKRQSQQVRMGLPPPIHDDKTGLMLSPNEKLKGMTFWGAMAPPQPPPLVRAGFTRGDTLVRINGKPFSMDNLHRVVDSLREDGKPFTVEVVSGSNFMRGNDVTKTLTINQLTTMQSVKSNKDRSEGKAVK